MKNKAYLIISIFLLFLGLLAITSFILLLLNHQNMIKWIVSLIIAIILVVIGINGIIDYKKY